MLIVSCLRNNMGKARKVVNDTHLLQANRDGFALGRLLLGDAPPQVDVRKKDAAILAHFVDLPSSTKHEPSLILQSVLHNKGI